VQANASSLLAVNFGETSVDEV
jgi:GTPase Era involved in 16S rRNA processing